MGEVGERALFSLSSYRVRLQFFDDLRKLDSQLMQGRIVSFVGIGLIGEGRSLLVCFCRIVYSLWNPTLLTVSRVYQPFCIIFYQLRNLNSMLLMTWSVRLLHRCLDWHCAGLYVSLLMVRYALYMMSTYDFGVTT